MSEEVLEIFEEKINILKGIRDELLSDNPETEFVIDINDPKEKRQIVLNQIYDRQQESLKHLKLSIKYLEDSMYKLGYDFDDEPIDYDDLWDI